MVAAVTGEAKTRSRKTDASRTAIRPGPGSSHVEEKDLSEPNAVVSVLKGSGTKRKPRQKAVPRMANVRNGPSAQNAVNVPRGVPVPIGASGSSVANAQDVVSVPIGVNAPSDPVASALSDPVQRQAARKRAAARAGGGGGAVGATVEPNVARAKASHDRNPLGSLRPSRQKSSATLLPWRPVLQFPRPATRVPHPRRSQNSRQRTS